MLTLVLALMAGPNACYQDDVLRAFHGSDSLELRLLHRSAPTMRDSLFIAYRLYSITHEPALVANLPDELVAQDPVADALLSALWGFKVENGGLTAPMRFGPTSVALIERALGSAGDDPRVLLIAAQHFARRPVVLGGSVSRSMRYLNSAAEAVRRQPWCGIDAFDIDMWRWMLLRDVDQRRAAAFLQRIEPNLPAVWRAFTEAI